MIYHYDYRGSVVAVTDINGNVTDTVKYDAYGSVAERTGTSKLIFGYNGKYGVLSDVNGLIYMRTRFYNPILKRFMNADIIDGSIADSTTLNVFAYVNGNPISYVDPFGLCREDTGVGSEITWEDASIWVHTALDVVGFVPYAGPVADALNAIIYGFEGDWLNAGLSAISLIPIAEIFSTGGKFVSKGSKVVGEIAEDTKYIDELVEISTNSNVKTKPNQVHHFATDKNKYYTQLFEEYTNKYDLKLDDDWNKEILPHQGRHPNLYHEFVLDEIKKIDDIANGDQAVFLELYEQNVKKVIRENPDMLYSAYWKSQD